MALRILVVDDEEVVRKVFSRSVRVQLNCEVHEAADTAEARSFVDTYSYDAVVTDLSFSAGKLEGLSLIEKIRAQPRRPSIVVCSGYEIANSLALGRGADAFLAKPVHPSELVEVLKRLLEDRSQGATAAPEKSSQIDELLRHAATRLFVQPIYRIVSTPPVLAGVEFLTRGPAGSDFERPEVLFAYARESHRECALDRHCVQNILESAVQIPEALRLSINVHASTLCSPPDFSHFLASCAARTRVDLARITVEVVEHAPAWNQERFLQTLEQLRTLGMRIALDDIGLGRSNFQMMIDARPDCFKLDRYFVHDCHRNRGRRAVIASIAKLAAEFGAEVIAEGVSTEEELRELQGMEIGFAQGYIFCPPKSLADGWSKVVTYDPVPPADGRHAPENEFAVEQLLDGRNGDAGSEESRELAPQDSR